ncbi:MAG: helix-turn-helix transcriptional regulator [Verrucomicrobia bacterium]|nr:helix-turn-helix transcriptional regulator [Verrucomicrobiota bacterium]
MKQAKNALLPEDFGARLRWFRNARNLDQAELGKTVGRTATSISEWEKGKSQPTLVQIGTIARVLGVSSARLAFGDQSSGADEGEGGGGVDSPQYGSPSVRGELREILEQTIAAAGDDRDRLGWIKVQLKTHVSPPADWRTHDEINAQAQEHKKKIWAAVDKARAAQSTDHARRTGTG